MCGLPHARGGVSVFGYIDIGRALSSPRPWGCFSRQQQTKLLVTVFPTPVGVFLVYPDLVGRQIGLPHARGGVS